MAVCRAACIVGGAGDELFALTMLSCVLLFACGSLVRPAFPVLFSPSRMAPLEWTLLCTPGGCQGRKASHGSLRWHYFIAFLHSRTPLYFARCVLLVPPRLHLHCHS